MSTADSYEIRRLLKALAYAAESSVGHFAFWDELRGGSRELDEYDVKHVQLIVDMVHALAERAGIDVTEGSTDNGTSPKGGAVQHRTLHVDPSLITTGTLRASSSVVHELVGVDARAEQENEEKVVPASREDLKADWFPSVHLFTQLGDGAREVDCERADTPGDRRGDLRSGLAERHESVLVHDASPSAGESAVPGQAGTASVEGEPVAGGPFAESPAATPHGREINPAALRSIRELAGVKSGDLARAAEISHSFLSNIEAGRKQPSPAVTRQLARRLGVPIDAITQTT